MVHAERIGRGSYPDDPDKAAQLKEVADKLDAYFAKSDDSAFDAVADPNITLHGDLLILDKDLSGAETVKKILGTYTKSYDYKHVDVAHGADIEGSSIFHFWLHEVSIITCEQQEMTTYASPENMLCDCA